MFMLKNKNIFKYFYKDMFIETNVILKFLLSK